MKSVAKLVSVLAAVSEDWRVARSQLSLIKEGRATSATELPWHLQRHSKACEHLLLLRLHDLMPPCTQGLAVFHQQTCAKVHVELEQNAGSQNAKGP